MAKTYIYTNDVCGWIYTEHPMMNNPTTSHTYISEEAIKGAMSDDEFAQLKLKLRGYNPKENNNV